MDDFNKQSNTTFWLILSIILVIMFFNHIRFDRTVLRNVDMEPFSEPIQEEIVDGETFEHKVDGGLAYITPIAKYQIYGRVGEIHFRPPKLYAAAMYPYDITILFGPFKNREVFDAMKIKMAATVSYWNWSHHAWKNVLSKHFKTSNEMIHYVTNNHICPANDNVRRGIKQLVKKDIVYIEGYLVKYELYKDNGSYPESGTSSTSRNDKEPNSMRGDNGSGSCEQIFVTRVVSRHGDFR